MWRLMGFALALSRLPAPAAVGFSLSPSSVTNTLRGKITLTITNINRGSTVTVERVADLNGNGVIDLGEPLVLSFQVSDGQVPLIAGVRNRNVPGDEDGLTNSQILVELFFPWVDSGASGAAVKSVFRVRDSTSSSAVQPFEVRQHAYPQGVSGRVNSAATGLPLAQTLVLLASTAGSTVGVTETDLNGLYTFHTIPGSYFVVPLKDGFVAGPPPPITVDCGQFATNDAACSNALLTISGKVSDSSSGAGLAGISVSASATNNLFVSGFTDTNGNYSLAAVSAQWKVKPAAAELAQIGYLAPAHRTTTIVAGANVSNVNFIVVKAAALIHGNFQDLEGNGVLAMSISGQDNATVPHEADGRSYGSFGTNATYSLGVRGGSWAVGAPSDQLALRGFTGHFTTVNLIDGQATNLDLLITRTNLPRLTAPARLSSSLVQFAVTGVAGEDYRVEASTNLAMGEWFTVLNTNAPCDNFEVTDPAAMTGPRFYRALARP